MRSITHTFRNRYWIEENLPINMEEIITKHLPLEIIPEPGILENYDIDAFLTSDLSGIVVDLDQYMFGDEKTSNRLRFSFAHEIGHYVLHRSIFENFSPENEEDYIDFYKNFPETDYSQFEWQANEFAGSLLVPRHILVKITDDKIQEKRQAGFSELLQKYPEDILERLSGELCKPFGVSHHVIELRLKVEGLWPPQK